MLFRSESSNMDNFNAQTELKTAFKSYKIYKLSALKEYGDIGMVFGYDTEFILLDAFREDFYGGTGEAFDWEWIKSVSGKKIFLAGGVTPDNIEEALALETYGVDLCSGVEKAPGEKDFAKMKLLFEKIANKYG